MNPEIILTIVLTILGVVVLRLAFAMILTGGDFGRILQTIKIGLRALRDKTYADQAAALMQPPSPPKPVKPSAEPLWLLALLQREGRLLDFLLEDIQAYSNEDIGASVRDIQAKSQKAIKEHLVLAPVLNQPEQANVEVPVGFDPSAIRLTGNVTGQPPFRGTLTHHGWRVQEIKIARPAEGQDQFVVQPAEVELP